MCQEFSISIIRREEYVRFHILTTVSKNMAFFLDIATCSLAEVYQRFKDA
jgi:hypothetical protein